MAIIMKLEVDYPQGFSNDQEDPVWYTDSSSTHCLTAEVTATYHHGYTRTISIYADGETRINYYLRGEPYVVRDAHDLLKHKLRTDADITVAHAEDLLEWINNPWFDLYDDEMGDEFMNVVHSLSDAIKDATVILKQTPDSYWDLEHGKEIE